MADIAHVVGQDLQLSDSGDIAFVEGDLETQQRILHRLLTSPGSYIWQLAYGAGLPGLIGSVATPQQVGAIVRSQMSYEATVSNTPEPVITLASGGIGITTVTINYVDAASNASQVLSLPIGA